MPVVERVHGPHHAEIYDVAKVYEAMKNHLEQNQPLEGDFEKLRDLTNYYRVPEDVCESYEAIFRMLSELDRTYTS